MKRPEFQATQIVVNVQGDEPDIDPALIDTLIESLEKSTIAMATASAPFAHETDIGKSNFVKVVTDCRGLALYFSRAVIPFDRDRNGTTLGLDLHAYRKHLGIYAYRREALLKLAAAPMCSLERIEKLEQLRALHLGMDIFVAPVAHAPHGVDTPDDYAAFVRRYHEAAGGGSGTPPHPVGGS
jgi:3-deoxy-manno-octulosonate cytidylyltransferase (CMP-KDO synthetase)